MFSVEMSRRFEVRQGLSSPVRQAQALAPTTEVSVTIRVGFSFADDQLDADGRFVETDLLDEYATRLSAAVWTELFEHRPTFERVTQVLYRELMQRIPQLAYVTLVNDTAGMTTTYQGGADSGGKGVLVVIRGNSASGKSSTAVAVQRRFDHSRCAVVSQDTVRRNMLREFDEAGAFNIDLVEQIARSCLARGMVVIVEGILDANRYGPMLERLLTSVDRALLYSFDLTFAETLVRHAGRPQAASIPPEQMAGWYHGWQPLPFADETRIDATRALDAVVERICRDIEHELAGGGQPEGSAIGFDLPCPETKFDGEVGLYAAR
ncbi:adenylyl-sulfate kinase [Nocardia sp. NPDC050193]